MLHVELEAYRGPGHAFQKLYSVILLWAISKIPIYFVFHHLSYEHAEAMFPIKLFIVFKFHQHVDKGVIKTSGVAVC